MATSSKKRMGGKVKRADNLKKHRMRTAINHEILNRLMLEEATSHE